MALQFVRRFMQHVLPTGIKRIRHYSVLASGRKARKLNAARLALQMPLPNPQAVESAQAFMARAAKLDVMLCPCCKQARPTHWPLKAQQLHAQPRTFVGLGNLLPLQARKTGS